MHTTEHKLNSFLDSQKIKGSIDTKILSDINGLSNLKLKGSKNQGFMPITVDAKAKTGVTFFDGNSTNNNIVLAKVNIKAEIIFVVKPGSVK